MDLKIEGKVTQILEEQSGTGKNGAWRKQDFILETQDQYPKKVCITQWGDKIDEFDVQEGEDITAFIDIKSREYNGKWYTDVKAWKIERGQNATTDEDPFDTGEPTIDMSDMDHDVPF